MSIVDAIQKAKRLAQDRAAENAPQPRRRAVATPSSTSAAEPITRPLGGESRSGGISAEPIPFARVPYNVATCAENRIIVPGIDARLLQAAAPPYRMLRTRILQRCRTNNWSVLGLTSPGPTEGKSVTSLNLAISIAREGNNDVFLIDLDMRNPSVARYLGVTPPKEISEFFLGGIPAHDVFFTVGIDNLAVAGSSLPVANASELLATRCVEELFSYVRSVSERPLVVLDLPPVVNTDDALVVAPRLDAMVLVVSEGHTRRDGLETALNLLSEFPIAGVVLNQSQESLGSEYYGAQ